MLLVEKDENSKWNLTTILGNAKMVMMMGRKRHVDMEAKRVAKVEKEMLLKKSQGAFSGEFHL